MESHPVKFSFHNGHIQSEVCSADGEKPAGLNIKRAIISLLQSSVHKDAGVASHIEVCIYIYLFTYCYVFYNFIIFLNLYAVDFR